VGWYLSQGGRLRGMAAADVQQMVPGVEARTVAVAPGELDRIIAAGGELLGLNRFRDRVQIQDSLTRPFIDTAGARALAAQVFERQLKNRAIAPVHFQNARVAVSLNLGRCQGHIRVLPFPAKFVAIISGRISLTSLAVTVGQLVFLSNSPHIR
jgi:hypothetical protein